MKQVRIYGDSLLEFVLWENGRYTVNKEPVKRFAQEFRLNIVNRSYFGSCVDKGLQRIRRDLSQPDIKIDYAILEFGGNDCAFNWKEIAEHPEDSHDSVVPLPQYLDRFRSCIRELREAGILPILTNLVPFDPHSYLNWVTRMLDREIVLGWLGEENRVYRKNELYSRALEKMAGEEMVPLIDLRSGFLDLPCLQDYYCDDGVHPNRAGQELIYQAFADYVRCCG